MRYSLLSRFQGALVGAALGDILGIHCHSRLWLKRPLPWLTIEQWGFDALPAEMAMPAVPWGAIAVDGIHQFTKQHRWRTTPIPQINATSTLPLGIAIAILPVALYRHDDLSQLRSHLQQTITPWIPDAETNVEFLDILTIAACTIALALQEQLNPHHLISELILDLQLDKRHESLTQMLLQLQRLIDQRVTREILAQELWHSQTPPDPLFKTICIALYGFLNTPEDVRLSLLQTAQMNYQTPIACGLVGAIAGAYNGLSGIPLSWRFRLDRLAAHSASPLKQLWNIASTTDLQQLAAGLLASWAGIYADPQVPQTLTVTVPDGIRPQ